MTSSDIQEGCSSYVDACGGIADQDRLLKAGRERPFCDAGSDTRAIVSALDELFSVGNSGVLLNRF